MSGNKNTYPLVEIRTTHDRLPVGKKRRVDITIEYHICKNAHVLVTSLPKSGFEFVVIDKIQAEKLAETFKIDIITVR